MKFYVFDIKKALSVVNKTENYEEILPKVICFACATINLNKDSIDGAKLYHEELMIVIEHSNFLESRLPKYIKACNRFKTIAGSIDMVPDTEGYKEFYDVGPNTIIDILLSSYVLVEDFDLKLQEAKSSGIINPIAYILDKETEHKLND